MQTTDIHTGAHIDAHTDAHLLKRDFRIQGGGPQNVPIRQNLSFENLTPEQYILYETWVRANKKLVRISPKAENFCKKIIVG